MEKADIGLIGLAVMGENLILNMESQGFRVAVYNRTVSRIDDFMNGRGKAKNLIGCKSPEALCASLKSPRKIMMMVKAGPAVDALCEQLLPHLSPGDILIDGGNSHFPDTNRRVSYLAEKGIHFIGAGVSGGEEGALKGPSIMPGGAIEGWETLKPIFQSISAKVEGNVPCCEWVGEEGSGHFVKMIHNGIEYGDMQLICEAYDLLKRILGLGNEEMAQIFESWNKGDLNSYLIEITSEILKFQDEDGDYVVDIIQDTAGQKGTGRWTVNTSLDIGHPLTLVAEAVYARILSSMKESRVRASKVLKPMLLKSQQEKESFIEAVGKALYCSKIMSYAQGFALMRAAAVEFKWNLELGSIALMWRGGCIIRSQFLGKIKEAYTMNPNLENLLLDGYFTDIVLSHQEGWRKVLTAGVLNGIPLPAMSAALCYFDGYRSHRLPTNLLQAQRDYFGAHTYERVDKPRGEFFHTNWTGRGGSTASSAYNA